MGDKCSETYMLRPWKKVDSFVICICNSKEPIEFPFFVFSLYVVCVYETTVFLLILNATTRRHVFQGKQHRWWTDLIRGKSRLELCHISIDFKMPQHCTREILKECICEERQTKNVFLQPLLNLALLLFLAAVTQIDAKKVEIRYTINIFQRSL